MILLIFLILSLPTAWELYDDRIGETLKQKKLDVLWRCLSFSSSAIVSGWIIYGFHQTPFVYYLKAVVMSFAIFFLVFDYAIIIILVRRKIVELPKGQKWYSYLSKSPLDKLWSGWDWKWRMAVRGAVFTISLIIYLWN